MVSKTDFLDFIKRHQEPFASEYNTSGSKNLLIDFFGKAIVKHNKKIIYKGADYDKAVELYNQIKLS